MGTLTQVGDKATNVVAHPGFQSLPAPQFALTTEKAIKRYDEICRLLWQSGRLSLDSHMTLSAYAKIVDQIAKIEETGASPRASWFISLRHAQRELKLDDLDTPIAAPKEASLNRFSRFGKAGRR